MQSNPQSPIGLNDYFGAQFRTLPDLAWECRRLWNQIPPGRVSTPGLIAEALGDRSAAIWIARLSLHHDHTTMTECVCHRIVRATGELGGYLGGTDVLKRNRLAAEGIDIENDRVDLQTFGFSDFEGDRPLERLRWMQNELADKVEMTSWRRLPECVGAVDAAYPQPDCAQAAYALVHLSSGELLWSQTVQVPAAFPYISGFLSFRELPAMTAVIELARAAGQLADAILVDGSGVLHPRGAGIASHLGAALNLATVGVTKKMLCGETDLKDAAPGEIRPVFFRGDKLGIAAWPKSGSKRPVFFSPGHRTDVEFAERIARATMRGRRLPEPIYWADRRSRKPG